VVIAAGSSGMAQSPSSSSTQPTVSVKLTTVQTAGTIVRIQTAGGEEIATFAPSKNYQSVVVSTPELVAGTAYDIIVGGSSTGTKVAGLYEGGAFTGGTKVATVTATTANASTGGMGTPRGR
jgi:hypothetical protein